MMPKMAAELSTACANVCVCELRDDGKRRRDVAWGKKGRGREGATELTLSADYPDRTSASPQKIMKQFEDAP